MVNVHSEIGKLRKVIVHRPDIGISRVSPKRAEELLFDDIVYLPQMRVEHNKFVRVLKQLIGDENVLEIEDLLLETLQKSDQKNDLIHGLVEFEELPQLYESELKAMELDELRDVLITGYHRETKTVYFDPIPNFIFTRDIAAMVRDYAIITKAAKIARHRENLLTKFIFYNHPLFAEMPDEKIIDLNDLDKFPPNRKGEKVSIEGGDLMMLEDDYLLIGRSERTSDHAFYSLKNYLFKHNIVKNVVHIKIPDERSFMHIDTLFTRINVHDVVVYKPIIYDGESSNVDVYRDGGEKTTYSSVKEFFIKEISNKTRFIFAANGESPFQEREQWTDACNLVAIRPGVAVAYDRNKRTEIAFKEAGYEILHAEDFLEGVVAGSIFPEELQNTIITLSSGELSRARGGSHCMTCPLIRD